MAEKSNVALNTFLLGLGLALVGGFTYWILSEPSAPGVVEDASGASGEPPPGTEFSFGAFQFDEQRLTAELIDDRHQSGDLEIGPDEEYLINVYHDANWQAVAGNMTPSQLLAINEIVTLAANSYVGAHGPRAYRALSWHVYDEFREALEDARTAAAESGDSLDSILAGSSAETRRRQETIGKFVDFARESGLFGEDNEPLFSDNLISAIFRYRWFKFSDLSVPTTMMTAYERTVFIRWRVEAALGLPLAQRLGFINDFSDVYEPSVDLDAVRAFVYYQAGDPQLAREFLSHAAERHPDDLRYTQWADSLPD